MAFLSNSRQQHRKERPNRPKSNEKGKRPWGSESKTCILLQRSWASKNIVIIHLIFFIGLILSLLCFYNDIDYSCSVGMYFSLPTSSLPMPVAFLSMSTASSLSRRRARHHLNNKNVLFHKGNNYTRRGLEDKSASQRSCSHSQQQPYYLNI